MGALSGAGEPRGSADERAAAPAAGADRAPTVLLAVPNISEGRDDAAIDAIAAAFASGGDARDGGAPGRVTLLDVHRDPDHNRSVVTLAGPPGALAPALVAGARAALERIDLRANDGVHPHVGALDVAPLVHLTAADRGAACAEALLTADLLARRLDLPVLLYGALAQGRTRAALRRGGPAALAERMRAGALRRDAGPSTGTLHRDAGPAEGALRSGAGPSTGALHRDAGPSTGALHSDFGPPTPHPTGGTTLVAARPPLVAFNVTLAPPATLEQARAIAAALREGGAEGLPGLRAIGLQLERAGTIQLSMNVERPDLTPLRDVVAAIAAHAPVAAAELVALAPEQAFAGFPRDLPIPGFDPDRHLIERALRRLPRT